MYYLLSILGACAWLPSLILLWDRYSNKSELYGKLLSLSECPDFKFQYEDQHHNKQEITGLGIIGKLVIQARNKDFFIKYVDLHVEVSSDRKLYESKIIWSTNITLKSNADSKIRRCKMPSHKHIKFLSLIHNNTSNEVYFTSIIPEKAKNNWSKMIFTFEDYSGNKQSIIVSKDSLDMLNILYENELWEVVE